MILLIARRNIATKSYGPKLEFKFQHKNGPPQIADLEKSCKEFYKVQDGESISIAKYFPHKFDWKLMDKDEEIIEKKKKGKEVKFKAANADLKKVPFFLKDGDIIGVRFESENIEGKDDFQTEEDNVLRD